MVWKFGTLTPAPGATAIQLRVTYYIVVWEAGHQACTLGETSVQLSVAEIPVRITLASLVNDGVCRIRLTGVARDVHTVQVSTNWLTGSSSGPRRTWDGQFQFNDANAAQFSRRFYRAVTP